jgi:hypothetical protein
LSPGDDARIRRYAIAWVDDHRLAWLEPVETLDVEAARRPIAPIAAGRGRPE